MGMLFDEHVAQLKKLKSFHNGSYGASINFAVDIMCKYQKIEADYNARLKADMVAMLSEIQLEIEKMEQHYQDRFLESKNAVHEAAMGGRMFACGECKYLIQQKINTLKADRSEE